MKNLTHTLAICCAFVLMTAGCTNNRSETAEEVNEDTEMASDAVATDTSGDTTNAALAGLVPECAQETDGESTRLCITDFRYENGGYSLEIEVETNFDASFTVYKAAFEKDGNDKIRYYRVSANKPAAGTTGSKIYKRKLTVKREEVRENEKSVKVTLNSNDPDVPLRQRPIIRTVILAPIAPFHSPSSR